MVLQTTLCCRFIFTFISKTEKIKILIATETDPETKHEVYTYYQNHKTEKSFNKEKFLEELLVKNYYFL